MGGNNQEFQVPVAVSITANGQSRDLTTSNISTFSIQITGTWSGTLVVEGTADGTNYKSLLVVSSTSYLAVTNITSNDLYIANGSGYQSIRIRSTAWTSGTANIGSWGSDSSNLTFPISLMRGSSDGTLIGNVGDRLKTEDTSSGPTTPGTAATKSTLIGGQYNLTLPTLSTGQQSAIQTDKYGRILISGQSEVLSPLPSVKIIDRRVLASSGVYANTHTLVSDTAIKEFTFGGRGPGEGMFGTYVAATQSFVPGGQFNSISDVAMWTSTGTEVLLGGTPLYSTLQAFEGTGSVQLQFDDSDANHTVEISYTYPTAISADVWRYVNAKFYNSPPGGGAVTRTISIVLRDTSGSQRLYSVSGLTNAAPFNAAGWIDVIGDVRIPTSQVGATFDINNIDRISLRLVDSGNKTGTVYWDAVKFLGALDILQKIYTNGNTIGLPFDPIIPLTAGQVIYYASRNNDTVSREYQLTIGGVDIT